MNEVKANVLSDDASFFAYAQDLEGTLKRSAEIDFWLQLNPELSITGQPFLPQSSLLVPKAGEVERAQTQVKEEGYFYFTPLVRPDSCAALAKGIERIVEIGLHPIYICVYDEFWQMSQNITEALRPLLGEDCFPLADFWVYHVSERTQKSGWKPHRDDQFEGRQSLLPDGRPLLLTAWMPLLETDPLNGCMYLLPTDRDPNIPDNLFNLEFSNYQDVRALPAKPGSLMGWNQILMHWGSRCSRWAKSPRISLGIYVQSAQVDPFVSRIVPLGQPLSFERRLAFLGINMLVYHRHHRYPAEVIQQIAEFVVGVPDFLEILPEHMRQAFQQA